MLLAFTLRSYWKITRLNGASICVLVLLNRIHRLGLDISEICWLIHSSKESQLLSITLSMMRSQWPLRLLVYKSIAEAKNDLLSASQKDWSEEQKFKKGWLEEQEFKQEYPIAIEEAFPDLSVEGVAHLVEKQKQEGSVGTVF